MNRLFVTFALAAGILTGIGAEAKNIESVIRTLWGTSPYELSSTRLGAMEQMQQYMDATSSKDFANYLKLDSAEERRAAEKGNVLAFYQAAMDKIVKELPKTKVKKGTVVIWHLYNMGYVVKTPSHCFAVDIKHPEAYRLIPYIEFLAITHHHGDHFTDKFNKEMIEAGKPVYANWDGKDYKTTNVTDVREIDFNGIHITTRITDHNKKLVNFMVCYNIDCGEDTDHCRIYFVGDSCSADQICAGGVKADILVFHLRVGLNYNKAAKAIEPQLSLVSHILELGHDIHDKKWRWSYWLGLYACNELNVDSHTAILPVWGEKIVFTPTSL